MNGRRLKTDYRIDEFEIEDIEKIDMLYEQREKISIIETSMQKFKNEDIKIFNLYYYCGKRNKEISKILNLSEFTVKQRLYRIRKKLKKDLEKRGYSYGK